MSFICPISQQFTDTAFKQQRLKAWQPILTPKTVLPTLFIIGIIFAPIGGLLIWGSSLVTEITFDYTDCEKLTPSTEEASLTFVNMPSNKYSYSLSAKDEKNAKPNTPRYAFLDNTNNSTITNVSDKKQCVVEFDIPADLSATVLLYYKLTNFYQNHRRYVKSLDTNQLKGKGVSASTLENGDCKPLATINGTAIYPCGLIANSLFNGLSLQAPQQFIVIDLLMPDTFSILTLLNPSDSSTSSETYTFSSNGIAWPGEAKKYATTPIGPGGYANLSYIVPPPNWRLRYPDGYTDNNPPPDLKADEHFQNWMRTAGLPTFTKLYGRNDVDKMQKGTYRIIIGLSKFQTFLPKYSMC